METKEKVLATMKAAGEALNAGKIAEGETADLIVFDPETEWKIEKFASKSQNSPFKDQILKGKIELTMCQGKILYSEME